MGVTPGSAGPFDSVNPAQLTDRRPAPNSPTPKPLPPPRRARNASRRWAAVPAPVRGTVIAAIGRIVAENKEALARLVTREVGKPLAEARGEVQEIVDTCDFFIGEGRRLYGETVPSEMPDKQLFTFRVPVGVAAVITAGNFPVAVPSWYLVPALLRQPVVWKRPSTRAPRQRDVRLFAAAGLPDGVPGWCTRRSVHIRRSGRRAGGATGRQVGLPGPRGR
jgi:aldehyde dehydrogenase (NAD+)